MRKLPPIHAIKYDASSLTVYGRDDLLQGITEELESQCLEAYPPAGKGTVGEFNPPWWLRRGALRIELGLCALRDVFHLLRHNSTEPVAAILQQLALGPFRSTERGEAILSTALLRYATSIGARSAQCAFAHDALLSAFGRGVLSLPTGFGKTWVAWLILATAADWLAAAGIHPELLVLVGSPTLAEQLAQSFADLTERSDQKQGLPHLSWRNLTITTYGRATAEELARANVLIVDECHQVPAKTRAAAVQQCVGTLLRVGLSATPFMRTDANNMWVAALLGPCVGSAELGDVIADGALAVPLVKTR